MSTESLSPENEEWRYEAAFSKDKSRVQLTRNTLGICERRLWCNERLIGEGGYGSVFLQRHKDRRTGEEYIQATKCVNLRQIDNLIKYVNRELKSLITARNYRELFVMFHGWYQDDHKNIFIVMDYIPGGDLDRFMKESRQNAKERCQEATKQLLEGVDVLHQHRICHRDLKPSNILVASMSPFRIKICDFGIAKGYTADDSSMVTKIGTRRYMAPEIWRQHLPQDQALLKKAYSSAIDIWAVGIICHELFTGSLPFWYPVTTTESCSTLPSGIDPVAAQTPEVSLCLQEFRDYCLQLTSFPEVHLETHAAPHQLKDLVKLLLKPEPGDRPKAGPALRHPWFGSSPKQGLSAPPTPVRINKIATGVTTE